MVSDHCALASETWNVVATLVISGAPRLPTTATTSAMTSTVDLSSGGSCPGAGPGSLNGSCPR